VVAVTDHQAAAVLIALVGELGDVGVDLGLERLSQHPAGALPADLVDQRGRRAGLVDLITLGRVRNYGEHRVYLPSRRCNASLIENLLSDPGRYTPSRRIHRFRSLLSR
jgi:hypothetical protein